MGGKMFFCTESDSLNYFGAVGIAPYDEYENQH